MPVFRRSTRKHKKYMVLYNGKWVHFGDTRYEQFKDSTPLKLYTHLDHGDVKRQKNYLQRSRGIRDGNGNLTYKNKGSPNYYSVRYLW